MPPIAFGGYVMHHFHSYSLSLMALAAALALTEPAAFAAPRQTPLERAQRIEALTTGGLYDPMTVPVSDRLAHQRDERPR